MMSKEGTMQKESRSAMNPAGKITLLALAAFIIGINLNTFVKAAGIIPGGFAGITLLLQEIIQRLTGVILPFSLTYYALNIIPVYIGFRYIGKWFTLYSCLMVVLMGVFTDIVPSSLIEYLTLQDPLLCAVFGGLINGGAIAMCLLAEATSGGSDFIAIYFAEKRGRDAWNYIFAANCAMLVLAGILATPSAALYSVIFQWVTTAATTALYKGYQQKTLLIITDQPDAIYQLISDRTHHDATAFTGIGQYQKTEHTLLYSVVSANEVHGLVAAIRHIDPNAFINMLKTEALTGRFYRRPKA
jgi:uncharacterized membrane-anchored protein YitT (DUF2179 family)